MLAATQKTKSWPVDNRLVLRPELHKHTMVHLMYVQSAEYKAIIASKPDVVQIFANHIMGEHEANPGTGSAADALSANGLGGNGTGTPGAPPGNPAMQQPGAAPPPGASQPVKPTPPTQIGQLPNLPAVGLTPQGVNQPTAQAADIQATNLSKPVRTGV